MNTAILQRSASILLALTVFIGGFAFGFWYADPDRAAQTSLERGKELGRLEERAIQQEAAQALLEAVRSGNPFAEGISGNPFRDAYRNPYGEPNSNPFE